MTNTDNRIRFDTDNQFAIIKLIEDAGPFQFVREFTQNAIEAGATRIHWRTHRIGGSPKLSIIDNGCGMAPDDLRRYMQTMACTGKTQGARANYGVGAKLAGLRFSPAGVLVRSWQNGIGAEVLLRLTGTPGAQVAELVAFDDGTYTHTPTDKPKGIRSHGTQVVFYGETADADTTAAPAYVGGGAMWVGRLLTSRYAHLPAGVQITVEEHRTAGKTNTVYDRKLSGEFDRLSKAACDSGTVRIEAPVNGTPMRFDVHWWLADEARKATGDKKTMMVFGHCGVLYDGELFDQYEGGPGTSRLTSFGVTVGTGRVVLYVEPSPKGPFPAKTDLTRTHVDLEPGVALPWGHLARAFADKMPTPIVKMMAQVSRSTANAQTLREMINSYLSEHRGLYDASRYQLHLTDRPKGSGKSGSHTGSGKGRQNPISNSDEEEAGPLAFPEWVWTFLKDGSRDPADGMEDRIARYDGVQHRVVINGDFRGIKDLVKQVHKKVPRASEQRLMDVTRQWVTIGLVEQVMSIFVMAGLSYRWDKEDVAAALSVEALTGGFYHRISATRDLIVGQIVDHGVDSQAA